MTGALTAGLIGVGVSQARAGETTASVDSLRTGWDQGEGALSAAAVRSSSFGQLWKAPVGGERHGTGRGRPRPARDRRTCRAWFKFAEALPARLAEATLAARTVAEAGARLALAEQVRFTMLQPGF